MLFLLSVLYLVASATTPFPPPVSSNLTGVLDDAPLAEAGVVTNDGSASPGTPNSVETRGGVDAPGDIGGRGGLMTYYYSKSNGNSRQKFKSPWNLRKFSLSVG